MIYLTNVEIPSVLQTNVKNMAANRITKNSGMSLHEVAVHVREVADSPLEGATAPIQLQL